MSSLTSGLLLILVVPAGLVAVGALVGWLIDCFKKAQANGNYWKKIADNLSEALLVRNRELQAAKDVLAKTVAERNDMKTVADTGVAHVRKQLAREKAEYEQAVRLLTEKYEAVKEQLVLKDKSKELAKVSAELTLYKAEAEERIRVLVCDRARLQASLGYARGDHRDALAEVSALQKERESLRADVSRLADERLKADDRAKRLDAAIRVHRDARSHERCQELTIALYEALGEPFDAAEVFKLPDLPEWLSGCTRYWLEEQRKKSETSAELLQRLAAGARRDTCVLPHASSCTVSCAPSEFPVQYGLFNNVEVPVPVFSARYPVYDGCGNLVGYSNPESQILDPAATPDAGQTP